MTGLFRRLAARAAGTAHVVRSNAVLPYAADRLPWAGGADVPSEEPDGEPMVAPARPRSSPRPDVAAEALGGGFDRAPVPVASEPRTGQQQFPPPPEPPTPPLATLTHDGVPASAQAPTPEPKRRRTAPAGEVARAAERELAAPAETGDAASARDVGDRGAPPALPSDPWSERIEAKPRRQTRGPERRATADPPPLRPAEGGPERPSPAEPTPWRAPADLPWKNGAALSATDAPNEVHVHIGRIEVIAEREAPRRRQQPGGRPPVRSLEAYLAARDKR
jgi:hypothetical protein